MFIPTKKEELKVRILVNEFLRKLKVKDAKIILGGSGAKDTWLPGTHDIDIFVMFNYKKYKDSDRLDNILEFYLKKKFKRITRLHGSRDYFQIKHEDYTFEIVPILDIKNAEEAKNITDISPLHIKWVNKYNYKEDIRKLKLFCKANKVYGAESYIKGFSGYALEALCIYYKGFKNLIKNVAKWKIKTIIDPEKHLKNPLRELNASKILSPLILVDPVDKTRNITAVLSKEIFVKFIRICKEYLKKPSENFFKEQEETIPKDSIILYIEPIKGKEDIIAAKMLKAYEFIGDNLKRIGFKFKSNWDYKRKLFWFNIKNKLSEYEIRNGPYEKDEFNVKNFKKIYKNAFRKNGRYYAKIKRKYTNAKDYIKELIKQKEVEDRVKNIRFKN